MDWIKISREEQETIINIDYYEKTISFYTNRKNVANRMIRKLGRPNHVDTMNGKICGIIYKRNLFDKDLAKFFSKTLLIGSFTENE